MPSKRPECRDVDGGHIASPTHSHLRRTLSRHLCRTLSRHICRTLSRHICRTRSRHICHNLSRHLCRTISRSICAVATPFASYKSPSSSRSSSDATCAAHVASRLHSSAAALPAGGAAAHSATCASCSPLMRGLIACRGRTSHMDMRLAPSRTLMLTRPSLREARGSGRLVDSLPWRRGVAPRQVTQAYLLHTFADRCRVFACGCMPGGGPQLQAGAVCSRADAYLVEDRSCRDPAVAGCAPARTTVSPSALLTTLSAECTSPAAKDAMLVSGDVPHHFSKGFIHAGSGAGARTGALKTPGCATRAAPPPAAPGGAAIWPPPPDIMPPDMAANIAC
eukprot:365920-Chlamydomonas_euryale.AAC.22